MTLKRTIELLKEYLKINNIIELTDVNKHRLDEINKIRDYFSNEIKERKDIIFRDASVVNTRVSVPHVIFLIKL